jgi:hypothetical protein
MLLCVIKKPRKRVGCENTPTVGCKARKTTRSKKAGNVRAKCKIEARDGAASVQTIPSVTQHYIT